VILTVLGSGTTLPDPERGSAGLLVEHEGLRLLVDGGSGTLGRLARVGVTPPELAGGVYSHRHPDHSADLVPLLFTLRLTGRDRDYPIWAGEGMRGLLAALEGVYGSWIEGRGWSAVVHELSLSAPDAAALPGALRLLTRPANHGAGALHLRFEAPDGASLVFSGDTGPSEELVELARGADVLVCECALSAPLDDVRHLWPAAVADLVDRARPRRVLLTHLYPEVDEAEALRIVAATGVPVERAHDLQRVPVTAP